MPWQVEFALRRFIGRVGTAARFDAAAAVRGAAARAGRPQRARVARRGRRHLPAALAAAEPLRRAPRRRCTTPPRHVPRLDAPRVPYVIGVAGSVAVGKSTTSRILQALLARWPSHPQVDLVTTDGFLLPQRGARGARPDAAQGLSGELRRAAPRASSWPTSSRASRKCRRRSTRTSLYDIVPGAVPGRPPARHRHRRGAERAADRRAGATGCSCPTSSISRSTSTPSEADIEQWYVERFLTLRETVFQNPSSYFHRYAALTRDEAQAMARTLVADDQPGQPARERAADARARPSHSREGARPRRPEGATGERCSWQRAVSRGQHSRRPGPDYGPGNCRTNNEPGCEARLVNLPSASCLLPANWWRSQLAGFADFCDVGLPAAVEGLDGRRIPTSAA